MFRWMGLVFGIILLIAVGILSQARRHPPISRWTVYEDEIGGDREIYLMQSDGSQPRRLTRHPGFDTTPTWSPRGDWIGFVSNAGNNWDIYAMRPFGKRLLRLTTHPAADYLPAWSPDGEWVVFVSERDGNADVYKMRWNGSQQHPLTTYSGSDDAPTWSADGEWITFSSHRDGNIGLFRMRADGSDQQRSPESNPYFSISWSANVVSPIVNLPWRAEIVLVMGIGLVMVGMLLKD